MQEVKGKCLCGAVRFTARLEEKTLSACHCGMCRRWSAGPLMVVSSKDVSFEGEDQIKTFKSSDWAERGFCPSCGSALYYRLTSGAHQGSYALSFGALEDPSGFTMSREWFIDRKPEAYSFEGERQRLTEAQVFAMFSGGGE